MKTNKLDAWLRAKHDSVAARLPVLGFKIAPRQALVILLIAIVFSAILTIPD